MKRYIMHIDMNSFFATCEQQANALLRGMPIGVAAYAGMNSILLAASVEAKQKGIKTGTSVREAIAICQKIVILENDPPKYRAISEQVSEVLSRYSDRIEPYSIDESFIDLTGWVQTWDDARKMACQIKKHIKSEIGEWLSCSIGISTTKFLAKVGSDMKKPDGLVIITPDDLPKIYNTLELTDLWGIAHGWRKKLSRIGINTIRDLYDYPLQNVTSLFGKPGHALYLHLHGFDVDPVARQPRAPKSISHQYAIPKKECTAENIPKILMRLCEKVGMRLRSHECAARTVFLGLRFFERPGAFLHTRLPYPVRGTRDIYQHASLLLKGIEPMDHIRVLSIGVSDLEPLTNQLLLFNTTEANKSTTTIDDILDSINNKYGGRTITRAATLGGEHFVPDRIAFGK